MRGIDTRRWGLSLALRAAVAALPTLGLALVLTAHTSSGGVDLAGAVPYFLPVLVATLLGGHYAARWEDASLDREPGGAIAGHTPWRRAIRHGVGCLAELSGVALVVVLPWISWQARVLTLVVLTAVALVLAVLSFARQRWGRVGRDLVLFIVASWALASLPVPERAGASLREVSELVALLAAVVMVGCLAVYAVAAVHRWRRARTVHVRRARLLERAHVVALGPRGE